MDDEVDFQVDIQGRLVASFPGGGWVEVGRIADDGPIGTFMGKPVYATRDSRSFTIQFVDPSPFIDPPPPQPPAPPPAPEHPRTAYLDIDAIPIAAPNRQLWNPRPLDW